MTQRKIATNSLITRARRDAKELTSPEKTYSQALDEQAVLAGYPDWRSLSMANGARNAEEGSDIPLDPVLPTNFDNTPNEDRSTKELDNWWERPFILSLDDGMFEVRCLDGGAWDRSTWYGQATTLDEAKVLAVTKLAKWRDVRNQPVPSMREDGLWDIVVFGGRPDRESMSSVLVAGVKTEDIKMAMDGAYFHPVVLTPTEN